jgi:hypothetical protein
MVMAQKPHMEHHISHCGPGIEWNNKAGRAITQAVSRWLPTATARVRAPVRSCEICGGRSGTGVSLSTSVSAANRHSNK